MRTVLVMFDSLNRHALGCYVAKSGLTPNMDRFANRAVTFDQHWVGSMPCMPARRDIQTGRLNMFHRSWGPMEPFDKSFVRMLRDNGTYTHLITDHYHYFEDGGCGYHGKFDSYDFFRGQEIDPWRGVVEPDLDVLQKRHPNYRLGTRQGQQQHLLNLERMKDDADFPGVKCFAAGFEFLEENRNADDWFLQIECFDPHEPFLAPEKNLREVGLSPDDPVRNWPPYTKVAPDDPHKEEVHAHYDALVRMCDDQFGRLMDYFDEHDLWEDTALILTTDHGFLLGEHEWFGKSRTPFFNEVAHIPLIAHFPAAAEHAGSRCSSLTQNIDIAPTVLELHGQAPASDMTGKSLLSPAQGAGNDRAACVFGIFGGAVNVTDGQYVYFRYPEDMTAQELYEYTLMPSRMRGPFEVEELKSAKMHAGFGFTCGAPVWQIPAQMPINRPDVRDIIETETALYDLARDPEQSAAYRDAEIEERLCTHIRAEMIRHEAPPETFRRIDLMPE